MAVAESRNFLSPEDMAKLHQIKPTSLVDVQVKTPAAILRVKTEIIGFDPGKLILLKMPDEHKWGNVRDGLYEGNKLVLRCILEESTGEIVAFQTEVNSIIGHPSKILFLNYPKTIQYRGLRQNTRITTSLPAPLYLPVSDGPPKMLQTGVINDISLSGCQLQIQWKGKMFDLVGKKVLIKLDVVGEKMDLSLTVCNQRQSGQNVSLGLKFDENPQKISSLLQSMSLSDVVFTEKSA